MPRKKHFNPFKAIHNRVASPERSEKREAARAVFAKQIEKEREIGVDPIHHHGSSLRKDASRPAWLKRSKAWDQAA